MTPEAPGAAQLLPGAIATVLVAALILVTVVLPAEYGIDPTGIGKRLGLIGLSSTPAAASAVVTEMPSAVSKRQAPYRSDETIVTLATGESAEIKATMRRADWMAFTWTTEGGPVDFEMHGEPANAAGSEYASYWNGDEQTSGHGIFEAPFDGTHGWYWLNLEANAVTIRLRTSGYYDAIGRLAIPTTPGGGGGHGSR